MRWPTEICASRTRALDPEIDNPQPCCKAVQKSLVAVAQQSQHGLDACQNRSDWQDASQFVALAPAIASSRRLPRHPFRLLGQRQHILPWDEPHPTLPLCLLLLRHLAHIDGVTSPGILHCELVVLWCVVVDGVVRIVLWCVVAVVPC